MKPTPLRLPNGRYEPKPIGRVFDRVLQTTTGCWEWQGARFKTGGYGAIRIEGRMMKAHRAAYIATYGAIPDGLIIRHRCDNPPCVNPAHLQLGTHLDNTDDRAERGRTASGERCARSKLTNEEVYEIRARHAAGGETYTSLAAAYSVTIRSISLIVRRETWKHI